MARSQLRSASTFTLVAILAAHSLARAQSPRVYKAGEKPNDKRLQAPTDLNGYFPFQVPATPEQWELRASQLRQRIKVATGLWPTPERTPLNPRIYGRTERDGFTVEKVYFESVPEHFVTGLLFRPDDENDDARRPAVLCPHGHGGRLQDYGADRIRQLIADGAERFEESGRFPKLARCATLARMGCVVFIYDMLGYADSVQISMQLAHRFAKQRPQFEGKDNWGLYSTQAELRLQSIFGIQTWNSIRALDFLEQLPDVDADRMAVTGGSGGGTQTIILCAIDPRPIAAFPNGMVSTSMQGGCTCENCCLLRIGTGNVELAALFAPKPQAMTAADDWTREMMTKGYPQLQKLYAMLGAKNNVYCRPLLHFPHNYNYISRATMYSWFNKHLRLGLKEPFLEEDYELLTPEEYTIWSDGHDTPSGGDDYERSIARYLAQAADAQLAALTPHDPATLKEYRRVVGTALVSIIGRALPNPQDMERTKVTEQDSTEYKVFGDTLRLKSHGEEFPIVSLFPKQKWNGQVVIWIDGTGKAGLFDKNGVSDEVTRLLKAGAAVVGADLFQQGEFLDDEPITQQRVVANRRESAAYTFCYNDTLFARRVHDVLTLIAWVRNFEERPTQVNLIGSNGAGAVTAAARAIAGGMVAKFAIDTGGFRFADLTSYRAPEFLPGAVKYGDLPGMLSLSEPHSLLILGERGETPDIVASAYAAAGNRNNVRSLDAKNAATAAAVEWLLDD